MYLKRLELQGFKSFADKTILEFKPGITSVIGPNGSGKSNISDAIRWVLGEQSMKSLRGAKSEDIIFAGTQERKSLGFAEVSIVIDNSDAKLPIEYAEVTVTRKIYRNGETGYFINKTPCRLKDILELFMDTGIGKDGYSIIGQGKIDEILSNKSEDRRHIFEEAAGIVKYRTRKQESEKKMEQTKLNLLRINDILTEIEGNIEPLKAQSEKAKQYLNLREELKNIEVGLFVYNINSYKEKLKQIVQDEEIMVAQKETEDEKLTSIQELKDSLKREIDEIILQIEQMQNIGFESSNKIEKMNSEIGISKERIQNNLNNKERLQIEIQEFETRIKELEEEEKQIQNELDNKLYTLSHQFKEKTAPVTHRETFKGGGAVQLLDEAMPQFMDKPFKQLTKKEKEYIYQYIRYNIVSFKTRLGRYLYTQEKRKIDMERTIQMTCKTGGIPLKLCYEMPKRNRANLILVLDISGSCREASEMLLSFMYLLKNIFTGGCRTYVFVNSLYDVTELMEIDDIHTAVQGVLQSVPTKGVYSDYNRPMEMLWTNNRKYLKKDSFVLFLGDYRNNKNKEGTEWLKNIHARAKKMFFLNTDKKEKWGQGDSIAPVYSRSASMYEARTPSDLIHFIDQIG